MPYAANLPRRDRPRGLGDLADVAGGLGTWAVTGPWGLSPEQIGGQPRPYGQTVVQTMYPRALQPRLLNLHMGPVLPGGTWPQLRRMHGQPVFRTPVERPGAVEMSLPPGAGGPMHVQAQMDGYAGYGWIPMGVARAPYYLLDRSGYAGGFGGFGQAEGATSVTALGQTITLDATDVAWIEANAATLTQIFRDMVKLYLARTQQVELYREALAAAEIMVPNAGARPAYAQQIVFGDPLYPRDAQRAAANMARVFQELDLLNKARADVAAQVPPGATAAWPTDLRLAYFAFVTREAPSPVTAAFGVDPFTGIVVIVVAIAAVVGVQIAGHHFGTAAASRQVVEGGAAIKNAQANSIDELTRAKANVENEIARALAAAMRMAETAPTEAQRIAALNAIDSLHKLRGDNARRAEGDKKVLGSGTMGIALVGLAALVGMLATRYLFATGRLRMPAFGGGGGGGGGGGQRREERSGPTPRMERLLAGG